MVNSGSKTIGVLSDTHLSSVDNDFKTQVKYAFLGCDTIIHAGDLTSKAVLDVFAGKEVYAVHGNMCSFATRTMLPDSITFSIDRYTFGLYHGDGIGYDMKTGLISFFGDVDCIIFGHTHRPLVQQFDSVLFVNPGTFRGTGRYGSPGTFAILTIDDKGLSADIHSLPQE